MFYPHSRNKEIQQNLNIIHIKHKSITLKY